VEVVELYGSEGVLRRNDSFYAQPSGAAMKLRYLRWKFCSQVGESEYCPRGEPYVLFGQDLDWTHIAKSVLLFPTPTWKLKAFYSNDREKLVRDICTKPVPLVRRDLDTDIGRWSAHLDEEKVGVWNAEEKVLK